MAKSSIKSDAARPVTASAGAALGAAQPPLDLSLGHIGTIALCVTPLKPVRTREDCFDWLTEDEVQTEVWAAFRGARRFCLDEDFDSANLDVGGGGLLEGTVLDKVDGVPHIDRSYFLGRLMDFIFWRIAALAEARGVLVDDNPCLPMGDEEETIRERIAAHVWGKYAGGEVRTYQFKTEHEAAAFAKTLQAGK